MGFKILKSRKWDLKILFKSISGNCYINPECDFGQIQDLPNEFGMEPFIDAQDAFVLPRELQHRLQELSQMFAQAQRIKNQIESECNSQKRAAAIEEEFDNNDFYTSPIFPSSPLPMFQEQDVTTGALADVKTGALAEHEKQEIVFGQQQKGKLYQLVPDDDMPLCMPSPRFVAELPDDFFDETTKTTLVVQ